MAGYRPRPLPLPQIQQPQGPQIPSAAPQGSPDELQRVLADMARRQLAASRPLGPPT
jgi:hypothetical protein